MNLIYKQSTTQYISLYAILNHHNITSTFLFLFIREQRRKPELRPTSLNFNSRNFTRKLTQYCLDKHRNREENYLRPSQNHLVLEGRDQPTPESQTHAHAEINPHSDRHRDKNPSPPRANPSPDRRRDQNPNPRRANPSPDRRRDQNPSLPSTQTPPENQQRRGESYGEQRR
jgi:hypothetical protein